MFGMPGPQIACDAYQCQCVEVLGVARLLQNASQLEDLSILLSCSMSRVPALSSRGNSGIVVVVIFGVERQLFRRRSGHDVWFRGVLRSWRGEWLARGCRAIGGGVQAGQLVEEPTLML